MTKLSELAKTIRSKNAGVDRITFDVIFRENETYTRVKNSGAITPESFAMLYKIDKSRIGRRPARSERRPRSGEKTSCMIE